MKKTVPSGLLISFEGIDGCGKSTLATLVKQALSEQFETVLTKEPGGTELGRKLRQTLLQKDVPVCEKAEFLLFATDRAQHFAQLIIPKLSEGCIILSDRMADSSLVYQGYGRNLGTETISLINNWAMHNRQPDIVFYLKIDAQSAYQRMQKRGVPLNSFEQEKNFMQKLVTGFDTLVAPRYNVHILDAQQDPQTLLQEALTVMYKKIESCA